MNARKRTNHQHSNDTGGSSWLGTWQVLSAVLNRAAIRKMQSKKVDINFRRVPFDGVGIELVVLGGHRVGRSQSAPRLSAVIIPANSEGNKCPPCQDGSVNWPLRRVSSTVYMPPVPTDTPPLNGAEPSSSPLKAPVFRGTRMRRLIYFYCATSRRVSGVTWSIFTPALIYGQRTTSIV